MNTLEILEAGRAMIAKPYGWKKYDLLVRKPGSKYDGAVCAVGAVSMAALGEATYDDTNRDLRRARNLLNFVVPANSIIEYNDTHNKACVIEAFDAAIAKAKEAA